MNIQKKVGIYCLANDKVFEWAVAFLESVRTHESSCQIIIIPFDNQISKLAKLSSKYKFDFFEQENILKELDDIGATLHPCHKSHIHRFRTMACFWGPLEHFMFFDSDIVLLSDLQELFQRYFSSGCNFMYYYRNLNRVYKAGFFRDKMSNDYSANGFNCGAFLSSRGVLDLDEVKQLAQEALSVQEYFVDDCFIQPFFNYCVDLKKIKTQIITEMMPDLGPDWAKFEPIERWGDTYQIHGKRLLYTHWAGFRPEPSMPNRQLFLHYRLKSEPWLSRLQYRFCDWLKAWQFHSKSRLYTWLNNNQNEVVQKIYQSYKKLKNYYAKS